MPVEYINRRGDRYFLLVGKTKTGKPKFYCSRKPGGVPAESLPDGYELHESPETAVVGVRKIRPSRIIPFERELVAKAVRDRAQLEYFIVEAVDDSLVVYLPNTDAEEAARIIGMLTDHRPLGELSPAMRRRKESLIQRSDYSKMMRFRLANADQRSFSADRWCFRGAYDNWWPLAGPAPLEVQLDRFIPHLGKHSFFELA